MELLTIEPSPSDALHSPPKNSIHFLVGAAAAAAAASASEAPHAKRPRYVPGAGAIDTVTDPAAAALLPLFDLRLPACPIVPILPEHAPELAAKRKLHAFAFADGAPPAKRKLDHAFPFADVVAPPPAKRRHEAPPHPGDTSGLPADSRGPPAPLALPGPIRCSECPHQAASATVMAAHVRASHPARPHVCGVCGRCFSEKGNLNKHHRTVHLKERRHACDTCGRRFAFPDGLKRHIAMVHLDHRPFECTHCQCPAGPHPPQVACTHICGMRFKQKSHRRRHVRSVHLASAK